MGILKQNSEIGKPVNSLVNFKVAPRSKRRRPQDSAWPYRRLWCASEMPDVTKLLLAAKGTLPE